MKRVHSLIALSACVMSLFLCSDLAANTRGIRVVLKTGNDVLLYQDYQALVVGISSYEKWPKLPYAVADAKEVGRELEALGFQVELVLDPTSTELKNALSRMTYQMGGENNRALLFYYAGHGATEKLADRTKMCTQGDVVDFDELVVF